MYNDKPVGFTAVNRLNNAPRELPPENYVISALSEDDFLYHIVDSCHSGSLVTLKGYDGKVAGSSGSNHAYCVAKHVRVLVKRLRSHIDSIIVSHDTTELRIGLGKHVVKIEATMNDRGAETLDEIVVILNMFESALGCSRRRLSAHGTYERVHMKITNRGSAPRRPSKLFGLLGNILHGNNNSVSPAQSRMASSNKEYDEYRRRP